MHPSLQKIDIEWQAMRGLTLELLNACSAQDLEFAPPGMSAVWKQFRHIGGIHETYLNAIDARRIAFDGSGQSYSGGAAQDALKVYFQTIAGRHEAVLQAADPCKTIDWFGEQISLTAHLIRLISHETLHHGQFIQQWRMRGKALPPGWQVWGV